MTVSNYPVASWESTEYQYPTDSFRTPAMPVTATAHLYSASSKEVFECM